MLRRALPLLLAACAEEPLLDGVILPSVTDAVGFDVPALPPPPAVSSLRLEPGDGEVLAVWQVMTATPVAGFELLLGRGDPGPPWESRWVVGATTARVDGLTNEVPVFVAVRAVDASGFSGPVSEAVSATPRFDDQSMIVVLAGEFLSGTREKGAILTVSWSDSFLIDRYPATNARYAACVDAGACPEPAASWGWVGGARVEGVLRDPDLVRHPATSLSWEMARAYCAWRGLHLPSAAERQKAARGPAPLDGVWPWGDAPPSCARASFASDGAFCVGGTEPVGSHPLGASPYGVHDLAGGVWEWLDGTGEGGYPLAGGAWYAEPVHMAVGRTVLVSGDVATPRDPQLDYRGYGVRCVGAGAP